ncbi:YybH family protein [Ideonella sp. YS5]|uniref:YybH family protein n=1 Tax=Ideonella sp. YS5 TaxID=3453714 RepID=UPI003EE86AE9
MPPRRFAALLGTALVPFAVAAQTSGTAESDPVRQAVWDTERAFAKTMADRDLVAFSKFLSSETVFQGGKAPLRGPDAVVAAWKKFFEGPQPPFSWEPDQVLVMTNGQLAMSSGPVRDPSGKLVARFNSVWRQEAPGVWRIVLDMGNDACECPKP